MRIPPVRLTPPVNIAPMSITKRGWLVPTTLVNQKRRIIGKAITLVMQLKSH